MSDGLRMAMADTLTKLHNVHIVVTMVTSFPWLMARVKKMMVEQRSKDVRLVALGAYINRNSKLRRMWRKRWYTIKGGEVEVDIFTGENVNNISDKRHVMTKVVI